MTTDRLAEIEQRANTATEGPWEASDSSPNIGTPLNVQGYSRIIVWGVITQEDLDNTDADEVYTLSECDRPFIAHARADIPWLIEQVRQQQAEIERLRGESFNAVVNRVCEQLPDDWRVNIEIDHDTASVWLYDDFGNEVDDFPRSYEGTDTEVRDAVEYAIEQAKGEESADAT